MRGVVCFTTTQREGHARVPKQLGQILKSKGLPQHVATAEQIHRCHIVIVPRLRQPRRYPSTDGLLTKALRQPLAIFTADCVPVFLAAPSQEIVGILHAGWRGAHQGILKRALALLRRRWGCLPQHVYLWVGPHIGPCCYEVLWNVARYFPTTRRRLGAHWTVDLSQELMAQGRHLGIPLHHMKARALCTRHHSQFYSYRRDRTEKRQVSVIMTRVQ